MTCQWVTVDGEQLRVNWDGEMTDEDRAAFTELVRATRRKMLAEAIARGPGAEALRYGRAMFLRERMARRMAGDKNWGRR